MADDPMIQKLKGKAKQTQGKLQEVAGDNLGGKIKQVEGKLDEAIAELRIQRTKNKRDEVEEESISREQAEEERIAAQDMDFDEDL